MLTSEQQFERIIEWFKEKNVNPTCPSCGQNQWTLGDVVAAPSFDTEDSNAEMIPMAQLICKNCAYMRLYAAVPIGLIEE